MILVHRPAKFRMAADVVVFWTKTSAGANKVGAFEQHAMVRVGDVGRRGHEQRNIVGYSVLGGTHEERNPVALIT